MIFALHRAEPKEFLPQFAASSEALTEFKEKHATVLKLFHRVAIDLQDSNYYRYQRSISGAMQEYVREISMGILFNSISNDIPNRRMRLFCL